MIKTIMKSIAAVLEEEGFEEKLQEDMDFVNDIGLDSLQLINVILDLEEQFELNIDFDEFDFDEVRTIRELADYLERLKQDGNE